jgi:hypothetical protein
MVAGVPVKLKIFFFLIPHACYNALAAQPSRGMLQSRPVHLASFMGGQATRKGGGHDRTWHTAPLGPVHGGVGAEVGAAAEGGRAGCHISCACPPLLNRRVGPFALLGLGGSAAAGSGAAAGRSTAAGCAAGLAHGIPAELEPAPTTSTRGGFRWGRLRPLRFGRGTGGRGAACRAQGARRGPVYGPVRVPATGQPANQFICCSIFAGTVRSAASKGQIGPVT